MSIYFKLHIFDAYNYLNLKFMRKTIQFLQLAFLFLLATACAETSPFKYESVPNDPLKARIYT